MVLRWRSPSPSRVTKIWAGTRADRSKVDSCPLMSIRAMLLWMRNIRSDIRMFILLMRQRWVSWSDSERLSWCGSHGCCVPPMKRTSVPGCIPGNKDVLSFWFERLEAWAGLHNIHGYIYFVSPIDRRKCAWSIGPGKDESATRSSQFKGFRPLPWGCWTLRWKWICQRSFNIFIARRELQCLKVTAEYRSLLNDDVRFACKQGPSTWDWSMYGKHPSNVAIVEDLAPSALALSSWSCWKVGTLTTSGSADGLRQWTWLTLAKFWFQVSNYYIS